MTSETGWQAARVTEAYRIVRLANGTASIHAVESAETFHPVVGPVAEAKTLYVEQLRLRERMAAHSGEFVIWDIGLGAAANALTALRETRDLPCPIRLESFDRTTDALAFALEHREELGYFNGYETTVQSLIDQLTCAFRDDERDVKWTVHRGDIPTRLAQSTFPAVPPPDVVLFDPCSLIRNPEMWTGPLFASLFQQLDPARPCSLATYSRSTMIRVSLLLAGFRVGVGHGVGEKEETTVAANCAELIEQPLDRVWLDRAMRSGAAEPMREAVYRQAPLEPGTREQLRAHPQFQ